MDQCPRPFGILPALPQVSRLRAEAARDGHATLQPGTSTAPMLLFLMCLPGSASTSASSVVGRASFAKTLLPLRLANDLRRTTLLLYSHAPASYASDQTQYREKSAARSHCGRAEGCRCK